jgi:hypothetical protein
MDARDCSVSEASSQEEEENEFQDEAARSRLAELIKKHQKRAFKLLKVMGSNLNDFLLRYFFSETW